MEFDVVYGASLPKEAFLPFHFGSATTYEIENEFLKSFGHFTINVVSERYLR